MKFDAQLAAYLYETKTLRLEGIGTFTLSGNVSVPSAQEKEIFYPIEGLMFVYNPKTDTDEDLITFLVAKLHKIQPLIRSDLESYLSNIKQFINLGKPYTIEGVGTLTKNNSGIYEFTPGNFLPVKEELHPKRENIEHNYPVKTRSSAGRVFVIIIIAIAALAALAGIGWGVSNLLGSRQQQTTVEEDGQPGLLDTLPQPIADTTTPPAVNTINQPATTNNQSIAQTNSDTVNYKMVFEITRFKERAVARTSQLRSYNTNSRYDTLRINDSLRYRLFIPMKLKPADTIRVKDSLSKFLGKRVFAVKQ